MKFVCIFIAAIVVGSHGTTNLSASLEGSSENVFPFQTGDTITCSGQPQPTTPFSNCPQFLAAECAGLNTGCSSNSDKALVICCPRAVPGTYSSCQTFCSACGTGAKCFDIELRESCASYCARCDGTCSCTANSRSCITTDWSGSSPRVVREFWVEIGFSFVAFLLTMY